MQNVKITRPSYEWAKALDFTESGNAVPYCASGWGGPEEGHTWTDGLNARLSFSVKPPTSDVYLVLSCFPFLGDGKIAFQELHIFVNFMRVGFAKLTGPTEIEVSIPKRVFGQEEVEIDIYLPRACAPASLGLGADVRDLAIAVNRLILIESGMKSGK